MRTATEMIGIRGRAGNLLDALELMAPPLAVDGEAEGVEESARDRHLFAAVLAEARQAVRSGLAGNTPAPPPRPTIGYPADFAGETLPGDKTNAPEPLDHISAKVAGASYDHFRHFTITLDSGQIPLCRGDDAPGRAGATALPSLP